MAVGYESDTVAEGPAQFADETLSIAIDHAFQPSTIAELVMALEQLYDVFLAMRLDLETGSQDLPVIGARLRALAPESQLRITALHFESPGAINLEGSGEILGELRQTINDLATIGQKRKRNKLEFKRMEQEIAREEYELEHQKQIDEETLADTKAANKLKLALQHREVVAADMKLAAEYLDLARQAVETRYGPDWRSVPGGIEYCELLMDGGNKLLELMSAGVIPPGPKELPETAAA